MGNFSRTFGRTGLWFRNHSPELLLIGGTVSIIVGIVNACKQTLKLEETIDEAKEAIDYAANDNSIPEKQRGVEIAKAKVSGAAKIAWLYIPSAAMVAGGFGAVYGSHHIMRKRYSGMVAAYSGMAAAFASYKKRVVDKFGEEVEKEIRYGLEEKEVQVIDEAGKEVTVTEKVPTVSIPEYSPYAKFFDSSSTVWSKSAEYNYRTLKNLEKIANQKLRSKGFLFLNEVYDMLDIPPTEAGQEVGWVFDMQNPLGDNQISFEIEDCTKAANRRFVNGLEPVILLDFNVDGNIREGGRFLDAAYRRR